MPLKTDNINEEESMNAGLFEGDLKLSKEVIMKNYNISSIPGGDELLKNHMTNTNTTAKKWQNRIARAVGSNSINYKQYSEI